MHQRKILLLENAAAQAAGVRDRLSEAGFQVALSRHESDGLKRLVEWGPDLVLISTAHPAGDFVEYCSRVRALAPGVRLIVSSSLSRDRLFQQYPGLQALVDGVLLRPYSHEEVVAVVDPDNAELRAEFQRQLDGKFPEIQELKRHLEVANRKAAAPGDEQLRLENERLRREVEESRKKTVLAFATEQLKRSEVEVKLDNLLRMKKDFEFRVQNEIDDRTQEIELLRGELRELRERSGKEAGEHALLRGELESALVEKEQIEERVHTLEAGAIEQAAQAKAQQRIAALEAELSRQRALEAEGQVALADMSAKLAILEESLAERAAAAETVSRESSGQLEIANAALVAELSVRLQAALEERRLFKERFDRASAEAAERERRSAALLQSAIDHGSLWSAERANLPAIVPLKPDPAHFAGARFWWFSLLWRWRLFSRCSDCAAPVPLRSLSINRFRSRKPGRLRVQQ